MKLDPRRIQFTELLRQQVDDPDCEGLNCVGCLFARQPGSVCREANDEALLRGLRDCDAVDQFGEVVIYVRTAVDPRQLDILEAAHAAEDDPAE